MRLLFILAVVSVITASVAKGAAQALNWHKVSETDTLVNYGWIPNPNATGYVFRVNGGRVSHTLDPTRSSVRFAKVTDGRYGIQEILPGESAEDGGPVLPPVPVSCTVDNYQTWVKGGESCQTGTTITLTNQGWACNRPLSSYGPGPLKVVIKMTAKVDGNGATFDNGCRGEPGRDINVFVYVEGHGPSGSGFLDDAVKFRQTPGASNIRVSGVWDCSHGPGSHSDGFQQQSNDNSNWIVNVVSGNWNTGTATCQGAGGMLFWSSGGDISVRGVQMVGCNGGLNGGGGKPGSGSSIIDSWFRTGRTDGSDQACTGFASKDPCINTEGMTLINLVCQRWTSSSASWRNVAPTK